MRSVRRYQFFLHAYPEAAFQMRRLADLVVACVVLAATLPLALLMALAIKCEGPGPIFERQTCIGRRGRRSQMLKFRTTVADREHNVPVWARKITQVGQFLRCTRIESLPQLCNVLRGE